MTRPNIVENGKITTVMLSKSDLDAIAKARGNMSVSGYIRYLVGCGLHPEKSEVELMKLREDLSEKDRKIEAFERERGKMTEEREGVKSEMSSSYKMFIGDDPYRKPTLSQCENWLESRCKNTGISVREMTVYLKEKELL